MHGTWFEDERGQVVLEGADGWSRKVRVVPVDAEQGTFTLRAHGNSATISVTKLATRLGLGIGDRVNAVIWEDGTD